MANRRVLGWSAAVLVIGLLAGMLTRERRPGPAEPPPTAEPREVDTTEPGAGGVEPLGETIRSEATPPSARIHGSCILEVRSADDRRLASAQVVVCRSTVIASGVTDEAGTFSFGFDESDPGSSEGTSVVVVVPSSAPQVVRFRPAPNRVLIRLPASEVVSGWVLHDGRPIADGVDLELWSDTLLLDIEAEVGLRWADLGLDPRLDTVLAARTDPEGSFSFDGLRADWRGSLHLPAHLRPTDRWLGDSKGVWSAIPLDRPARGLRIDVERQLRLLGRVVRNPGGPPVAHALIHPAITYPARLAIGFQGQVPADSKGSFELTLQSSSVVGGSLTVWAPDSGAMRVVPIEARELENDWDLGDVPMLEGGGRELAVRVVDGNSAPIAGAVASLAGRQDVSVPTDSNGRTIVRGAHPGSSQVCVYAVGFESAIAQVPAEEGPELVVTLTPGTLLTLRLRETDGRIPRPGTKALIRASDPPFGEGEQPCSPQAYWRAGNSIRLDRGRRDGEFLVEASCTKEGLILLSHVAPGVPLRYEIEGRYEAAGLALGTIAALGPGEHREVEVTFTRPCHDFRCRVVDERGMPLVGAHVAITYGGNVLGIQCDEHGEVLVRDVCRDTLDLAAEMDGCVPAHDPEFPVPTDGSTVELRLVKGLEVEVTVRSAAGAAIAASVHGFTLSGANLRSRELAAGQYLLRGVPSEPIRILATTPLGRHEIAHDGANPRVAILEPSPGDVDASVRLRPDAVLKQGCALLLVPRESRGAVRSREDLVADPRRSAAQVSADLLPGTWYAVVVEIDEHGGAGAEISERVDFSIESRSTTRIAVGP